MNKQQAGFTLIELVVVIVVLGILAGIAIPKYVDLATESRAAVVGGTKGALISSAALYIAKNNGAIPTATLIKSATIADNGVVITQTGVCTFNIAVPGDATNSYVMGTAGGFCQ